MTKLLHVLAVFITLPLAEMGDVFTRARLNALWFVRTLLVFFAITADLAAALMAIGGMGLDFWTFAPHVALVGLWTLRE